MYPPRLPDLNIQRQYDAAMKENSQIKEKYDKMLVNLRARQEQEDHDPEPMGKDTIVRASGIMYDGVHLIRCDTLPSWKVLHLEEIEKGPNWGISLANFND